MNSADLEEIRDRLALARHARRTGKFAARLFHVVQYLQLRAERAGR